MTGHGLGGKEGVKRHRKELQDKLEMKKPKISESFKPTEKKAKKVAAQSNIRYKFNIKTILKKREAECEYWKKSAEIDKQMKVVDELFQKEENQSIAYEDIEYNSLVSLKLGYIIFDRTRYNTFNTFKNSSDCEVTNFSQRLLIMSVEESEFEANIIFNHLMKANWSPVLDDVKHILQNWGAELDTLINKPSLKCEIKDQLAIGRHNFELVMNFLSHSILEADNGFSDSDLLTLAKFTVTISFDYYCGQNINVLKKLFSVCIETAFNKGDETAILAFAQELYSKHEENEMLKIVVDLFLPLDGNIMKQIYSYLTFKLFKSFLGKSNNINAFPSDIKDWFVQDLVDKNYFKQNPTRVGHVIRLLEHVVIIFDLYKDEEKLSNMYDFLYSIVKPAGLSESSILVNILDQWRLHLFRLKVNRHNALV